MTASAARAGELVRIPSDRSPGIPAYARVFYTPPGSGILEMMEIYHTDEWAAIPFYHDAGCVPPSDNLLVFPNPDAYGCPYTYEGIEVWSGSVPDGPVQSVSRGLGSLPVWFAPWPLLQEAIADGVLTIGELGAIPGLMKGTAEYYHERLAPFPFSDHTQIVMIANGHLEDGTRFSFHSVVVGNIPVCCSEKGPKQRVSIQFK